MTDPVQCIFAIIILIGVYYLPDSPRWMLSRGYEQEGRRICAALENSPLHSEKTNNHVTMIMEALNSTSTGASKPRKRDLLTSGPTQHLRRALIGASSQVFQQIGGCNAVIYFSPVIFQVRHCDTFFFFIKHG